MPKILLLEDDENLNETIAEFLSEKGYEVLSTYDGEEAQDKLYEQSFDLLLLDVNVPNLDGFSLLKQERENKSEVPAIFITSLNSVDDVERGFLSGANDYIRKPFSLKELLLRVENLLRTKLQKSYQIAKNITFNKEENLLLVNKKSHHLQIKEAKLLELLFEHKNSIVSHENIQQKLWDYDETASDGALRTYVKNLRKYLGKTSIVSVKKLGYKLITQ